ncbi:Antennal esterase CXE17 [Operophtera brumata]|uniref:Carboxylic ester hydrolase n=1 Tax=Operophtera brumata TaxID=104452 RepID=A0A0L7LDS4_OPEBR|nr:Antennal esterase CXE17 [Operophtera brumata]
MWLVPAKWLVLWSLWAARLVPQFTPTVRVSSGLLRGIISPAGDVNSYTGITFATVERRFQAPGPAPSWEGVFNAFDENIRCRQSVADIIAIGQQDCLALNVYTPINTPPEAKLPVMVFIHGGGFFQGSSSPVLYGPRYLVRNGVILVTVNYRLNIQGFLCLGIKEAPGNAAGKDHVAGLKWVQQNIKAFGGDPDRVTIFGESAGAASVSYLVLSPMAKGLFHRAITQSGSALSPWAYQFNPVYLASLLAKTMLYETQDPHELYKFFMTKSDDELILTRVPRLKGNVLVSEILYTPCAEKVIAGVEPFLIESPYDVLYKGNFNKVPMIVGATTKEGLMLAGLDNDTMMQQVEFEKALPKNLDIPSEEVRKEIAGRLKQLYMGDTEGYDPVKLSQLYGEPHLVYPVLEEVELILKASDQPIYTYIFDYSGWRNMPKMTLRKPLNVPQNATHADELFYMFSQEMIPSLNPTPQRTELLPVTWEPVDLTNPVSLLIREEFSTAPMWYTESLRYLREVYSKYRRHRNPTPQRTELLPVTWEPVDLTNPVSLLIREEFSTAPMWYTESLRYLREVYSKYRRHR